MELKDNLSSTMQPCLKNKTKVKHKSLGQFYTHQQRTTVIFFHWKVSHFLKNMFLIEINYITLLFPWPGPPSYPPSNPNHVSCSQTDSLFFIDYFGCIHRCTRTCWSSCLFLLSLWFQGWLLYSGQPVSERPILPLPEVPCVFLFVVCCYLSVLFLTHIIEVMWRSDDPLQWSVLSFTVWVPEKELRSLGSEAPAELSCWPMLTFFTCSW